MGGIGAELKTQGPAISPMRLRETRQEVFPGVFLYAVNLPQGQAVLGDFHAPWDSVEFGYVLSGRARIHGLGHRQGQRLEFTGNSMVLRPKPGSAGHFQTMPGEDVALLGLELTGESAERFLGSCPALSDGRPVTSQGMSAQERCLAWQLLDQDAHQEFGPLYRQGLVLQLLAVSSNRLAQGGAQARDAARPLGRPERQRVLAARALLDAASESQVDLETVAREVGLSPARLKSGFQRLTGCTPFRYLHEQKMHHSRRLLLTEGCSVSEAAWRIGYTNVSHFGEAFRRKFGILPGELLGRCAAGAKGMRA